MRTFLSGWVATFAVGFALSIGNWQGLHAAPVPEFQPLVGLGPDDALKPSPYAFNVSPTTGAARWHMSLNLPPGRNGLKPDIGLIYDSQSGTGILGLGFALTGLSSVSRCWTTPSQDGTYRPDRSTPFGVPDAFCLDGQRLVPLPDGSGFLLEFDRGTRVKAMGGTPSEPAYFQVEYRDGRIAYFGRSDPQRGSKLLGRSVRVLVSRSATLGAPIDSDVMHEISGDQRTLAWGIDSLEDRYGNRITYSYRRSDDMSLGVEQLISNIAWTENARLPSPEARRSVSFEYEPRVDPRRGFRAGVRLQSAQRLKRVVVRAPSGLTSAPTSPQVIREYRFEYAGQRERAIDRLEQVTECYPTGAGEAVQCLHPVSFDWSGLDTPLIPRFIKAPQADPSVDDFPVFTADPAASEAAADVYDLAVGDVDGDGRDDVLYRIAMRPGADMPPGSPYVGRWRLRMGTPTGLSAPIDVPGLPLSLGGDFRFGVRLVDVDGDGKAEAVLYSEPLPPPYGSPNPLDVSGYKIYRFNAETKNFDAVLTAEATSEPFQSPEWPRRSVSLLLGDLDGDGRVDLIRDGHSDGSRLFEYDRPGMSSSPVLRLGSQTMPLSFGATAVLNEPSSGTPIVTRIGEERYVVDIDGNGQPDLLIPMYNEPPPLPVLMPATFSAITAPPLGSGSASVVETTLPALPAEVSEALMDSLGVCPFNAFGPLTRQSRWFADLDGDGLPEVISVWSSPRDQCENARPLGRRLGISSNAGTAFRPMRWLQPNQLWAPNASTTVSRAVDPGLRVVDLDGDGRQDLLLVSPFTGPLDLCPGSDENCLIRGARTHGNMVWLRSTGELDSDRVFEVHEVPGLPLDRGISTLLGAATGYGPRLTQVADVNGDGLPDVVSVIDNQIGVYLHQPDQPDIVTRISGGPHVPAIRIHYSWGSLSNSAGPYRRTEQATCDWPKKCAKSVGWVVDEYREEVSFEAPKEERVHLYRYEDAVNDLLGRGRLGFRHVSTELRDEQGTLYSSSVMEFDHDATVRRKLPSGREAYAYANSGGPVATSTTAFVDAVSQRTLRSSVRRTWCTNLQHASCDDGRGFRLDEVVSVSTETERRLPAVPAPVPPRTPSGIDVLLRSSRQTLTYDQYGNWITRRSEVADAELSFDGPVTAHVLTTETRREDNEAVESLWWIDRFRRHVDISTDPSLPVQASIETVHIFDYEPCSDGPTVCPTDVRSVTRAPDAPSETASTSGWKATVAYQRDRVDGSLLAVTQSVPPLADGSTLPDRRMAFDFVAGDTERIFVGVTTNALQHSEHTYRHAGLGFTLVHDDANGVRTRFVYDALGRQRLRATATTTDGAEATTTWTYLSKKQGALGSLARNRVFCVDSAVSGRECTTLDPSDRPVDEFRNTLDDQAQIQRVFDRFGRTLRESLPRSTTSTQQPLFIERKWDGLGRLRVMSRPGTQSGAPRLISSTDYEGLTATSTSERGTRAKEVWDFAGRLTSRSVSEPTTGRTILTTMGHWHGGALRWVSHPDVPGSTGLRTTVEYDTLGRRTALHDPDLGVQTFLYNGFDEPKLSSDGTGAATSYEYDVLGRLVWVETAATANYTSRTGWAFARRDAFSYDPPNGLGLLRSAKANAVRQVGEAPRPDELTIEVAYDPLARPATLITRTPDGTYRFEHTYDKLGRLESLEYPSSGRPFRIRYEYASTGDVLSVWNTSDDPGGSLVWRLMAQNISGQPTAEQFGQTAGTTRTYDDLFQPQSIMTRLADTQERVQWLWHSWGPDGLLERRKDFVLKVDEEFGHDFLGRLEKWSLVQNCMSWDWVYGYDDRGNLLSRSLSRDGQAAAPWATMTYDGPQAHSPGSIALGGGARVPMGYDGAGQLGTGYDKSISWTPFGLPLSVTAGSKRAQFLYDAFGQRVQQERPDLARHIVSVGGGLAQLARGPEGDRWTYQVLGSNGALANVVRQPGLPEEVRFLHLDHLGNPDTVTGERRVEQRLVSGLLDRGKYDPYGQRRHPWAIAQPVQQESGSSGAYGFTGHEGDDAFGQINMRGRVYDTTTGRFLSPDPLAGSLSSEGLNRYSYVFNSPLIGTDPTGFECVAAQENTCAQIAPRLAPPPAPPSPPQGTTAISCDPCFVITDSLSGVAPKMDETTASAAAPRVEAPKSAPGDLLRSGGAGMSIRQQYEWNMDSRRVNDTARWWNFLWQELSFAENLHWHALEEIGGNLLGSAWTGETEYGITLDRDQGIDMAESGLSKMAEVSSTVVGAGGTLRSVMALTELSTTRRLLIFGEAAESSDPAALTIERHWPPPSGPPQAGKTFHEVVRVSGVPTRDGRLSTLEYSRVWKWRGSKSGWKVHRDWADTVNNFGIPMYPHTHGVVLDFVRERILP